MTRTTRAIMSVCLPIIDWMFHSDWKANTRKMAEFVRTMTIGCSLFITCMPVRIRSRSILLRMINECRQVKRFSHKLGKFLLLARWCPRSLTILLFDLDGYD